MKAWKTTLVKLIRVFIALMWATAAFGKLDALDKFRVQLGQSPLLQDFGGILLWLVPIGEIFVAVMLLVNHLRKLGLYASVFLLSLFVAYIVAILQYSYYIPCSCSGFAEGLSWQGHIVFNLIFLALAIIGIFIDQDIKLDKKLRNRVMAAP